MVIARGAPGLLTGFSCVARFVCLPDGPPATAVPAFRAAAVSDTPRCRTDSAQRPNADIPFRAHPTSILPPVDIAELKRKSVAELHAMADDLNISNFSGLRKQDLIFRNEQNLPHSDIAL